MCCPKKQNILVLTDQFHTKWPLYSTESTKKWTELNNFFLKLAYRLIQWQLINKNPVNKKYMTTSRPHFTTTLVVTSHEINAFCVCIGSVSSQCPFLLESTPLYWTQRMQTWKNSCLHMCHSQSTGEMRFSILFSPWRKLSALAKRHK